MNAHDHLGDIIFTLSKNLKQITETALREYGLGTGQLQLLFLFYSHENLTFTQKELSVSLKVDKGNISRSISKLINKGYIERDSSNERLYKLTSQGIALKSHLISFFTETNKKMTAGISHEQLSMTFDCLLKMNGNLEDLNES